MSRQAQQTAILSQDGQDRFFAAADIATFRQGRVDKKSLLPRPDEFSDRDLTSPRPDSEKRAAQALERQAGLAADICVDRVPEASTHGPTTSGAMLSLNGQPRLDQALAAGTT